MSAMIARSGASIIGASTSGRNAKRAATVALPHLARRNPAGVATGLGTPLLRPATRAQAQKDDRKGEPGPSSEPGVETNPFFEPLLRGLVLGVGAGVLCELLHVGMKVTDLTTEGGFHLPTAGHIYEQLAPLFAVDHAVALTFWLLFYAIEAVAILAILREYPDDKQASKVIKSTVTLPKRLMPLKLSSVKRTLHNLLHGRAAPQAAREGAAPMAFRGDAGAPTLPGPRPSTSARGAGAAVLDRPTAEPPKPQGQAGSSPQATAPKAQPAPKAKPATDNDPANDNAPASAASLAAMRRSAGLKPGQLTPGSPLAKPKDAQEAKREKELTDRRAYLQNFWYAAAVSDKITGKPTKVDILSRTVTIWRAEDGTVHCLDNVCPHRGAPLSAGKVKTKNGKSCVVCPYHGWAFNGQGQLEDVPSQNADKAFPKRPLVDAYPVEERGGFVWLFFGSKSLPADERPPIPMIPELEDPNWRAVYGEMEMNSAHWSVFDNAVDFAHIHYVHDSSFGNPDKPVINDMKVTRDTWGIKAEFSIHNKPVNPLWSFTSVPSVPVESVAMLPSTSGTKITLGGGVQMITYVNTIPIDEHRSINRFCLIRNFATSPVFDPFVRKEMYKILGEDKHIIEQLKPKQIRTEVSLEADKPQIAFHKLRQEWIDMGYGVDPAKVASHSGSLRDM